MHSIPNLSMNFPVYNVPIKQNRKKNDITKKIKKAPPVDEIELLSENKLKMLAKNNPIRLIPITLLWEQSYLPFAEHVARFNLVIFHPNLYTY